MEQSQRETSCSHPHGRYNHNLSWQVTRTTVIQIVVKKNKFSHYLLTFMLMESESEVPIKHFKAKEWCNADNADKLKAYQVEYLRASDCVGGGWIRTESPECNVRNVLQGEDVSMGIWMAAVGPQKYQVQKKFAWMTTWWITMIINDLHYWKKF